MVFTLSSFSAAGKVWNFIISEILLFYNLRSYELTPGLDNTRLFISLTAAAGRNAVFIRLISSSHVGSRGKILKLGLSENGKGCLTVIRQILGFQELFSSSSLAKQVSGSLKDRQLVYK